MDLSKKDQLANYVFVVTILWIGFIMAISFIETPLRFRAESITLPVALQVGKLVFHALNCAEIVFAVLICICHFKSGAARKSNVLLITASIFLIVQTLLLFTVLDTRTNALIAGELIEGAPFHLLYIGLEVVKFFTLIALTANQIREFKKTH